MPSGAADIIGNLRDAPALNLFVLVGFMLIVLAAVGRVLSWTLDIGGRILSGVCGIGLLGAATAMFLGVVKARAATPTDLTPPHGGTTSTATAAAPTPLPAPPPPAPETAGGAVSPLTPKPKLLPKMAAKAAAPHPIQPLPTPTAVAATLAKKTVVLPAVDQYGDWGCEESKTIRASLVLPAGAEFESATVDVNGLDKAKSFQKRPPSFDPHTRTVTGEVEFHGLDRVFFNCPGGGHATVHLTVTALVQP